MRNNCIARQCEVAARVLKYSVQMLSKPAHITPKPPRTSPRNALHKLQLKPQLLPVRRIKPGGDTW